LRRCVSKNPRSIFRLPELCFEIALTQIYGHKIKKPREKHEALKAKPFLAKGEGSCGLRGCPDLRRFADHSGGTVADLHGLPHFSNLLNVKSSLWRCMTSVNKGGLAAMHESVLYMQKAAQITGGLYKTNRKCLGFR